MRLCRWFRILLRRRVKENLKRGTRVRLAESAPDAYNSRAHLLSRLSILPGLILHAGDASPLCGQPLSLVQRPSEGRGGDLRILVETSGHGSASANETRNLAERTRKIGAKLLHSWSHSVGMERNGRCFLDVVPAGSVGDRRRSFTFSDIPCD